MYEAGDPTIICPNGVARCRWKTEQIAEAVNCRRFISTIRHGAVHRTKVGTDLIRSGVDATREAFKQAAEPCCIFGGVLKSPELRCNRIDELVRGNGQLEGRDRRLQNPS